MKKETKPKKGPPKPNKHKPHIPFERLTAMIEALESNGELDATIRAEMHDALDCLYMLQVVRMQTNTRKARSIWDFTLRIAHELVTRHGATIEAAVLAANMKVDSLNLDSVTHQYRVMKRRGSFDWQWINDERIALAASRLPKKRINGE